MSNTLKLIKWILLYYTQTSWLPFYFAPVFDHIAEALKYLSFCGFWGRKARVGRTELILGLSGGVLDCVSKHVCFGQILFTCAVSRYVAKIFLHGLLICWVFWRIFSGLLMNKIWAAVLASPFWLNKHSSWTAGQNSSCYPENCHWRMCVGKSHSNFVEGLVLMYHGACKNVLNGMKM